MSCQSLYRLFLKIVLQRYDFLRILAIFLRTIIFFFNENRFMWGKNRKK